MIAAALARGGEGGGGDKGHTAKGSHHHHSEVDYATLAFERTVLVQQRTALAERLLPTDASIDHSQAALEAAWAELVRYHFPPTAQPQPQLSLLGADAVAAAGMVMAESVVGEVDACAIQLALKKDANVLRATAAPHRAHNGGGGEEKEREAETHSSHRCNSTRRAVVVPPPLTEGEPRRSSLFGLGLVVPLLEQEQSKFQQQLSPVSARRRTSAAPCSLHSSQFTPADAPLFTANPSPAFHAVSPYHHHHHNHDGTNTYCATTSDETTNAMMAFGSQLYLACGGPPSGAADSLSTTAMRGGVSGAGGGSPHANAPYPFPWARSHAAPPHPPPPSFSTNPLHCSGMDLSMAAAEADPLSFMSTVGSNDENNNNNAYSCTSNVGAGMGINDRSSLLLPSVGASAGSFALDATLLLAHSSHVAEASHHYRFLPPPPNAPSPASQSLLGHAPSRSRPAVSSGEYGSGEEGRSALGPPHSAPKGYTDITSAATASGDATRGLVSVDGGPAVQSTAGTEGGADKQRSSAAPATSAAEAAVAAVGDQNGMHSLASLLHQSAFGGGDDSAAFPSGSVQWGSVGCSGCWGNPTAFALSSVSGPSLSAEAENHNVARSDPAAETATPASSAGSDSTATPTNDVSGGTATAGTQQQQQQHLTTAPPSPSADGGASESLSSNASTKPANPNASRSLNNNNNGRGNNALRRSATLCGVSGDGNVYSNAAVDHHRWGAIDMSHLSRAQRKRVKRQLAAAAAAEPNVPSIDLFSPPRSFDSNCFTAGGEEEEASTPIPIGQMTEQQRLILRRYDLKGRGESGEQHPQQYDQQDSYIVRGSPKDERSSPAPQRDKSAAASIEGAGSLPPMQVSAAQQAAQQLANVCLGMLSPLEHQPTAAHHSHCAAVAAKAAQLCENIRDLMLLTAARTCTDGDGEGPNNNAATLSPPNNTSAAPSSASLPLGGHTMIHQGPSPLAQQGAPPSHTYTHPQQMLMHYAHVHAPEQSHGTLWHHPSSSAAASAYGVQRQHAAHMMMHHQHPYAYAYGGSPTYYSTLPPTPATAPHYVHHHSSHHMHVQNMHPACVVSATTAPCPPPTFGGGNVPWGGGAVNGGYHKQQRRQQHQQLQLAPAVAATVASPPQPVRQQRQTLPPDYSRLHAGGATAQLKNSSSAQQPCARKA